MPCFLGKRVVRLVASISRACAAAARTSAMKMENEISAPQDGTIASIDVRKGDTVNSGDVLYTMG